MNVSHFRYNINGRFLWRHSLSSLKSSNFISLSLFLITNEYWFSQLLFLPLSIWPCYFSFLSVYVKNYINWSLNIEWTSHTKVNPTWLWCIIHFMHCWTLCVCVYVCVLSLSRVQLCVTPWTVACQAPLSMGFSYPLIICWEFCILVYER